MNNKFIIKQMAAFMLCLCYVEAVQSNKNLQHMDLFMPAIKPQFIVFFSLEQCLIVRA